MRKVTDELVDEIVAELDSLSHLVWFTSRYNEANMLLTIWERIGSLEQIKKSAEPLGFKIKLRENANHALGYLLLLSLVTQNETLFSLSDDLAKALVPTWYSDNYAIAPLRTSCVKIRRSVIDAWFDYSQRNKGFTDEIKKELDRLKKV